MSCHLSHKLPWDPILALYVADKAKARSEVHYYCKGYPDRSACHLHAFAREFVRVLHEFRATDKSTDHDMVLYDPKTWGTYGMSSDFSLSHHRRVGYYESLLFGYLELNLLLLDPERVVQLMMPKGRLTFVLRVLIGDENDDQNHPDHLASHLRRAFQRRQLGPLTREVLQILRNHAAMLFRCMYSVTGENKLLNEETVAELLIDYFQYDVLRSTRNFQVTNQ